MHRILLALTICSLPFGVSVQASSLTFVDISQQAGFTPDHSDIIPAGGVAVADFNGNGYPDIFVTGGQDPNRMFFNRGNGTFRQNALINAQLAGENCLVTAAADFNNNGWPDLYVGCRGSDNLLLANQEGNGFVDVTPDELNHIAPSAPTTRTDTVAWGDLTGNGHLDLFIGIFTPSTDTSNPDNLNRIMLNNGDGTWTNAADHLDPQKLVRPTLAATISDLNGNGRPDIYVINDKMAGNVLWRNDGPGCDSWCFTDIADPDTTGMQAYGMGIAIGDVSRNGYWDLYFSSIFDQHLLRGTGTDPLTFVEDTDTPLGANAVGWATIFADFDNDGWEDAYLAVGPENFNPTPLNDHLYRNQQDGTFSDVTAGSGLGDEIPTQGAAYIDFNRNGKLDLVLHHWNQSPGFRLYENTTADAGHWIAFELTGGGGVNRGAVGSLVVIETPDGGVQRRELRAGESRASSHQPILHFGLGEFDTADVTVHWPDGQQSALGILSADRYHRLYHPEAERPVADIHFANLEQVYTGKPLAPTVTTDPEGLNVVVTYDGEPDAPTEIGEYLVEVSIDETGHTGSDSATFTILEPTPVEINLVSSPTGETLVDEPLTPPLIVEVLDSNGNRVTGDNDTVIEVSIEANPAGGSLGGQLSRSVTDGVVTFADLFVDTPGIGYRLLVEDADNELGNLMSDWFDVTLFLDALFHDRFETKAPK